MVGTTSLAVSFGLAPFLVAFCRSAHQNTVKKQEQRYTVRSRAEDMERVNITDERKNPKKTLRRNLKKFRTCCGFRKKNYIKIDKSKQKFSRKEKNTGHRACSNHLFI
jgi:hypothetical protein